MNTSLAVGVTLLLSSVSGIAMWGHSDARVAMGIGATASERAATDGALIATARALLDALDPRQRESAVVAANAGPAVMLRAAVAPAALGVQRGLPWSAMTEPQRALAWWLLRGLAGAAGSAAPPIGSLDDVELQQLSFAWAGDADAAGAAYCRVHGARFVIEWFRPAGATGQVGVRTFATDDGRPWFRERFVR